MREKTLVLKLGGSVLDDDSSIDRAVHEIYRFSRHGIRVIAVVSARRGRTDALFDVGRRLGLSGHALAAHVASGELESTQRLRDALSRAGVPARALEPHELGLTASGDPLSATLTRIAPPPALADAGAREVLVAPGFVAPKAIAEGGQICLLGRGGSDLTALAIASALRCRCRLIKDVPGLYEADPNRVRTHNRRFRSATFATAKRISAPVIAPQALAFAESRSVEFEIAGLGRGDCTRIGARVDAFATPDEATRPLRVALLGAGNVGSVLLHHLLANPETFEVTSILVRDAFTAQRTGSGLPYTTDPERVFDSRPDVVVELLGGERPALELLTTALERGSHVVTANKTLLAHHGTSLAAVAKRYDKRIASSAAVGGSVPLLETASRLGSRIRSIHAVLNGTTNFVLDALSDGIATDLPDALARARHLGLCEPDPRKDLSGEDAAEKLRLLAHSIGVEDDSVEATLPQCDLSNVVRAIREATKRGERIKQVANLVRTSHGWATSVRLDSVPLTSALASCRGAENVACFELVDGSRRVVSGTGAGPRPTTEALLGDLLDLARRHTVDGSLALHHSYRSNVSPSPCG